ncbi:MAG TPA: hypothetical protein VJ922_08095 [Actinomycetota bacterium]|nr:hypothetical protein [Actinomycetota bacterium]
MARRRLPPREGLVETIGGIKITRRRAPGWLLFVILAIVSWGLFYLITYSVTDAGSFRPPEGLIRVVLGSFGP